MQKENNQSAQKAPSNQRRQPNPQSKKTKQGAPNTQPAGKRANATGAAQEPKKNYNNNNRNKQKSAPKGQSGGRAPRNEAPKAAEALGGTHRYSRIMPQPKAEPVKISFLGGLNEIGKNMAVYEYGDSMMIVDCGLAFPDSDLLGVDFVIPDFTYVERNIDKLKGVVITHGHEDHIGALAYFLKRINTPVYATLLTSGLIKGKLSEHGLEDKVQINVVKAGDEVKLGDFSVEFIKVNHSIPDSVALAIKTKAGVIIQTGDFKIDTNPIDGGIIDLSRFAQLGSEGVLCLLSDSTNAEQPGYSQSESKVGESFQNLFMRAGNHRIIIATFASNIHRVQQIINIAASTGRKVALSGRSLENAVTIASDLGYVNIPEGTLITIDEIKNIPDDKLVIITTGSQGEPMSALARMSTRGHRKVEVGSNDCIIISARPIPGNEKTVFRVINDLMRLGAEVIYEKMYEVHVSGHACQEELRIMLSIVKPKFFIPVHGEQKHLRHHAALAEGVGIPRQNILITDNGCQIAVSENAIGVLGTVASGNVYVDGYGVGDVGTRVMRERQHLGQDGIILIASSIDASTGEVLSGPEVVTRGFVYVKEAESLINEAVTLCAGVLESCAQNGNTDIAAVSNRLRDEVSRLMYEKTKRSPMIVPILLKV